MTKFFAIGLQRTGTTSLHQAAQLLGLRSAPMSTPLLDNLHDPLIDQYDLFSDNPIPLLYQQLDQLYLQSKFILTTRPLEAWLKSVAWLFTVDFPRLSAQHQQLGNQIHTRFYGRTTFSESIFREKWHVYHQEVDTYFAQRPQDLLRLDFSQGDGWAELCPFVGRPIPSQPFPHRNKRHNRHVSHWRTSFKRNFKS